MRTRSLMSTFRTSVRLGGEIVILAVAALLMVPGGAVAESVDPADLLRSAVPSVDPNFTPANGDECPTFPAGQDEQPQTIDTVTTPDLSGILNIELGSGLQLLCLTEILQQLTLDNTELFVSSTGEICATEQEVADVSAPPLSS